MTLSGLPFPSLPSHPPAHFRSLGPGRGERVLISAQARIERLTPMSIKAAIQTAGRSHLERLMCKIICCLLASCLTAGMVRAEELRTTFSMDADPDLTPPAPVKVANEGYKPLWLQTLARPEADLQRLSAETIAQAHQFGFPGMAEARPTLLKILQAADTHPLARFAAARALIVLDTRDAAPALFEASQSRGADLRQLIEPALANWKYEPARAVWRKRLTDPDVRYRDLLLAIQGVPQLNDVEALPFLLSMVLDPLRPAATRLAAARAAGLLLDAGLESEAQKLMSVAGAPIHNRLCAVALLERHMSEASRAALLQLAVDQEPSVAAAALGRLLAIDPELVLPLAAVAMKNPDPIVRQRGAQAWISRPNPQRVGLLTVLLDDVHPQVRGDVRDALHLLAKTPEFDATLRPALMAVLAAESWRGQEQAALLLGALDHKAAAPRFVRLLESARPEVMVTAAWGLKKLALPDTLPAILDQATRQTAERRKNKPGPPELDLQVAHLFELLGMLKHAPAEPLLREYIPKSYDLGEFSRPAAVWAMGHFYDGRADEALAQTLAQRMSDANSSPPEMPLVRGMCAVTLARMGAKSQAPAMRKLLLPEISPAMPFIAIRWGLISLTGEKLPEVIPFRISKSGWFVSPLDDFPENPVK